MTVNGTVQAHGVGVLEEPAARDDGSIITDHAVRARLLPAEEPAP